MALKEFVKGGSVSGKEKLNAIVKAVNKLQAKGAPLTLSLCVDGVVAEFVIYGYKKQQGIQQ